MAAEGMGGEGWQRGQVSTKTMVETFQYIHVHTYYIVATDFRLCTLKGDPPQMGGFKKNIMVISTLFRLDNIKVTLM